ncbi:hypothetical protein [Erythrobacter sp. YJ-T3-07]|uniref:hypothetical protein n=1 Tax=Erythrobacter sp. YJ-T3-07 TaxID=2793063 RepID=UPI0018D2D115|nr:hypothetical protein [Erythrobacter sp. YJ-T3-07]
MATWQFPGSLLCAALLLAASSPLAAQAVVEDWQPGPELDACFKPGADTHRFDTADACAALASSARDTNARTALLLEEMRLAYDVRDREEMVETLKAMDFEALPTNLRIAWADLTADACFEFDDMACAAFVFTKLVEWKALRDSQFENYAVSSYRFAPETKDRLAALELNQQDVNVARVFFMRALVFAEAGENLNARNNFVWASRLLSGEEDAYLLNIACWRLVTVYRVPTEAKWPCEQLAKDVGDYEAGWDSLGAYYLLTKNPKQALAAYDRAVALQSEYWHARYGRGVALTRLGQTADGEAEKTAAQKNDPGLPIAYREYGF